MADLNTVTERALDIAGPKAEERNVALERVNAHVSGRAARERLRMARENLPLGLSDTQRDTILRTWSPTVLGADRNALNDRMTNLSLLTLEGFGGLPGAEQTNFRNQTRDSLMRTGVYGDVMRGMDPSDRADTANRLLADNEFLDIANSRLHAIPTLDFPPAGTLEHRAMETRRHAIQAAVVAAALPPISENEARRLAFTEMNMNSLLQDSVQEWVNRRATAAEEVVINNASQLTAAAVERARTRGDEDLVRATEKLNQEYGKKGAFKKPFLRFGDKTVGEEGTVMQDWRSFNDNDLRPILHRSGVPGPEITRILADPELRLKYQKQFGEDLLVRRWQIGGLKQEDYQKLYFAKWLGNTTEERVNKLQALVTTHQNIQELNTQLEDAGLKMDSIWQHVKSASPGVAAGTIGALIAALFAPTIGIPLLIGAAGLGHSAFKFGRKEAA